MSAVPALLVDEDDAPALRLDTAGLFVRDKSRPQKSLSTILRERLTRFVSTYDGSTGGVAWRLGVQKKSLSDYLLGLYKGNLAELEEKITAFLNANTCCEPITAEVFVETSVSQAFYGAAEFCREGKRICLVLAPAGRGKTEAARHYVQAVSEDRVKHIECCPDSSGKAIFSQLAEALRCHLWGNTHDRLRSLIQEVAQMHDPFFIFDEGENIDITGLSWLRKLNDLARVPLLICGTESLLKRIRSGSSSDHEYLLSRISSAIRLPELSVDDIKNVAEAYSGKKFDEREIALLQRECRGSMRRLVRIVKCLREFELRPTSGAMQQILSLIGY